MTKRVLVCDDSVLMRKMVADCLIADGWEVVAEAACGAEAVQLYQEKRPDAVTMDIVMPETDGIYALDHIREFDPDARIIMVSALNQTSMISEAIRHGAYDFISKPFMPDQLHATMNSCLEQAVEV